MTDDQTDDRRSTHDLKLTLNLGYFRNPIFKDIRQFKIIKESDQSLAE